jgi:hypothetical protein
MTKHNSHNHRDTAPAPERALAAAVGVLQAATAAVRTLEAKRGDLLAAAAGLDQERRRISFAAHMLEGNAPERLAELRDLIAEHDAALVDIDAALQVGNERVSDAQHALEQLQNDQRLAKIGHEQQKLVAVGRRLDQALADFTGAAKDLVDIVDALYALDHPRPNRAQINSLGFRALSTAMSGSFWAGHFQRLQPAQRVTFTALATAWVGQDQTNTEAA